MRDRIHSILHFAHSNDLYPDLPTIEGQATPETIIEGRKMLMFSSNNYLGLSHHPEVIATAVDAVKRLGVGSDGSRLLSGNLSVHQEFERLIALFKGGEASIMWPSGYAANVGTIAALMNPLKVSVRNLFDFKGVIFSDELNHASIIDGIKMSRQRCVIYRHRDVNDLHTKLKWHPFARKLVVTDSVFSMDGADIAPLDKIAELCKKYNALLMIDEVYATGAPVVPVGIKGVFKLTLRDFLFRARRAAVTFGEPLLPREIIPQRSPSRGDYKAGAALVLQKISELM